MAPRSPVGSTSTRISRGGSSSCTPAKCGEWSARSGSEIVRRQPMADDASCAIAIVGEADADRRTTCILADRVLCERVAWIDADVLDHYRHYRGALPVEPFVKWTDMIHVSRSFRPIVRGHHRGGRREP